MQRRQILALSALGMAGLAGCSGGSGGAQSGGEVATATAEPTATPTPTATPAEFEFVELSAAGTVELGEPHTFSWTVRNTGGQDGVVTTPISYREAGGEWQQADQVLELEVPAGETATWESQPSPYDYIGEVEYRLDRWDEVFSVKIVPKTLDWGRPHTLPNDVQLICSGVDIVDSFEWSASGYDYIEEAPSGKTFGLLSIRAENNAGEPALAPRNSNFYLIQGNQQYNPQIISTYPEQYRGGEIQAGIVSRGDIVYEIDAGATQDDLEAVYSAGIYSGNITVYWGRN